MRKYILSLTAMWKFIKISTTMSTLGSFKSIASFLSMNLILVGMREVLLFFNLKDLVFQSIKL